MSTFNNLFPNNSDISNNNWNQIANNLLNHTVTSIGNGIKFGGNENDSLPYDQTPTDIRQYLLIFRLVLLGIGTFDTILLLAIYIKCTSIINNCLGIYVANISIAALFDMIDAAIWSLNEFGYKIEDYNLPWWVEKMTKLPQFALPTISLFFTLLIIDRLFATCLSNCHKACYGWKINAVFITLLIWLGSFFMTFILIYKDMFFEHDKLYEVLRFLIAYLAPFIIKLLLLILLFAKRKMVPDSEQSQAFIQRQRESLYYVLTIITIHLLFSTPYYATQINHYFHIVQMRIDEWIIYLFYVLSELPLIFNPIFVLSIDPDFRDSLVFVCTCSSRNRRDMTDLCDDHAESQPLAPMATSPVAEEKEHLDEAES